MSIALPTDCRIEMWASNHGGFYFLRDRGAF